MNGEESADLDVFVEKIYDTVKLLLKTVDKPKEEEKKEEDNKAEEGEDKEDEDGEQIEHKYGTKSMLTI